MAFCVNCGAELADGVKFCENCGAPQTPHMQPQAESQSGVWEEPQAEPKTEPQTSGSYGQNYAHGGETYGEPAGSAYAGAAAGAAGMYTGQEIPRMGFAEAVQTCFAKYATFDGRARRSEYWFFTLFTFLGMMVANIVGNFIFGDPGDGGRNLLEIVFNVAVFVPGLAVAWRRMHDIGKSGLWNLLTLVPIVGWIVLLVFRVRDSDPGENEFGMSPKYPL